MAMQPIGHHLLAVSLWGYSILSVEDDGHGVGAIETAFETAARRVLRLTSARTASGPPKRGPGAEKAAR